MPYYLYQYVDKDDNILYIGKTIDIYSRHKAHQRANPQYSNSKYFKWTECESQIDMDLYEKYLISKYHPIFNIIDNNKGDCSFILPELTWNKIITKNFNKYFFKQQQQQKVNIEQEKEKLYKIESLQQLNTINDNLLRFDESYNNFYIPQTWKDNQIFNNLTLIEQKILLFFSSFNKENIYCNFSQIFSYYNIIENWEYHKKINELIEKNLILKNENGTITLQNYSEKKIIIPKFSLQNKFIIQFMFYIWEDLEKYNQATITTEKIYNILNFKDSKVYNIKRALLEPFNKLYKDLYSQFKIEYTFIRIGKRFTHLKINRMKENNYA